MRRALHAEWTKLRTVSAWLISSLAAALMIVVVALLAGVSSDQTGAPPVPLGPNGEPVSDSFFFVHQLVIGNGSITASVSDLRSSIATSPGHVRPGVIPWAKAGLIIKQSPRPGSPYAAILITPAHGIHMQTNFLTDTPAPTAAGVSGAHWLRLTRTNDTVTGSTSPDGIHWTTVNTAHITGLGPTSLAGPFVTSPPAVAGQGTLPSLSTAVFTHLHNQIGDAEPWTPDQIAPQSPTFAGYPENSSGSSAKSGHILTITGAGDIAPATRETLPTGGTLGDILTGAFAALIALTVLGALYVTTEYRNSMVHVTLAATPNRFQVLLAKALILGSVTFTVGFVGAVLAAPLGTRVARAHGLFVFPVTTSTELRVALGTAALLTAVAILALALGVVLRTSAATVTTVVVAVVVPYLLIANPFMPASVADRIATFTPVAGFAVQQTLVRYPQIDTLYKPYDGYYPLAPWAGLAVLAAYALTALAVAAVVFHRRDA